MLLLRSFGFSRAFAVLCASWVSLACGEKGEECAEGSEGCACYPNKTCNDDLTCLSNLCVDPDGKSDPDDGEDGGGGGSEADGGGGAGGGGAGGGGAGGGEPGEDAGGVDTGGGNGGGNGGGGTPPGSSGTNDPGGSGTNPDDTGGMSVDTQAPEGSPVAEHGALRVVGTHLVDEAGKSVQLKGVSSMWLNWEEDGYAQDKDGLRYMRDNWNLSVIRAAMGVEAEDDSPTYLTDPAYAKAQVEKIVDNAIELGVYVIIDWHDHDAIAHKAEAQAFFSEMAEKYGDVPNVLYEVFNEPLDVDWSAELKPYHEALRDTIRAEDSDNVILLGTPNWDQDVVVAAQSPLEGGNLMYTLHFYSCDHQDANRASGASALGLGLPIFVSEWGAASADGIDTDSSCISAAAAWHDWMDENGISWAAWKFDNCSDATCFFVDDDVPTGGDWSESQLNGLHPEFAIARMKNEPTPVVIEPVPPTPDPPTGCSPSGTCAGGDAQDCGTSGEPIEVDCDACAVLSCGADCCDRVGHFGAYVTEGDYAYVEDSSLVSSYSGSASEVSLVTAFDETIPYWFQQIGALSFRLTATRSGSDAGSTVICVDTDQPDMMGATFENGEDGCAVALYDLGDGCYAPLALETCWGAWISSIGSWNQVNVRTIATQESTDFSTYLSVTSITIP